MIRRKSISPAKQAVRRKETGRRLRLWGELGEIGGIAHLWRLLIIYAERWQQSVYRNYSCRSRTYQCREDNHFIESGYREASRSLQECLYSWTYIHNETGTCSHHKLLPA
jgi:hypothetical protein